MLWSRCRQTRPAAVPALAGCVVKAPLPGSPPLVANSALSRSATLRYRLTPTPSKAPASRQLTPTRRSARPCPCPPDQPEPSQFRSFLPTLALRPCSSQLSPTTNCYGPASLGPTLPCRLKGCIIFKGTLLPQSFAQHLIFPISSRDSLASC